MCLCEVTVRRPVVAGGVGGSSQQRKRFAFFCFQLSIQPFISGNVWHSSLSRMMWMWISKVYMKILATIDCVLILTKRLSLLWIELTVTNQWLGNGNYQLVTVKWFWFFFWRWNTFTTHVDSCGTAAELHIYVAGVDLCSDWQSLWC